MGNFARKLIDAVQNTMLDKLFMRLMPFWGVALLWDDHIPWDVSAGFFLVAALVFFAAWVLGALARLEPSRGRSALERMHDAPENGFEVWGRPPSDGVRPPELMRWLVTVLGASDREPAPDWLRLLTFALFLAALLVAGAVATKPPEFWSAAPWLTDRANRGAVLGGATLLVVGFAIRGWASDQRALLENRHRPAPQPSRLMDYGGLVIVAAAIAATAVIWWSVPIWIALLATIGVALAGLFPLLSTKVMNVLFGDRLREPPTGI